VGIDRYTVPGAGLQGCVADALAWRELLVDRSGVDAADIVTLTDEQATGRAVRDAVGALVRASAPGDTAVLVIASHGSWKVDRGGDEADRYDETICPHDCDRGQIGDDELGRLLDRAVDGVRLTVVVDACHSGTVTRGLEPGDVARTLSPWIADPAGHGAGRRHRPVDRRASERSTAAPADRRVRRPAVGGRTSARIAGARAVLVARRRRVALVAHVTLGSLTRDGTHRTVRVRRRRPTAGRQRTRRTPRCARIQVMHAHPAFGRRDRRAP
jgi:hypothetical protein